MGLPSPILHLRITIHPVRERYGSDERLRPAPLGHRRPAFCSVINQLSRPRRDFIRAAADFQGLTSHAGNQGPVALFLFLVVRANASSDWLVCRPLQFALALCRSLYPLVIGAGAYRSGG